MSFGGTKSPVLANIKRKPSNPIARDSHGHLMITPEQEAEIIRLYPTTFNEKLMEMFHISLVTLQRIRRRLGLEKDPKVIKRKQTSVVKRTCEKNGYYESLRGKRPSEATIEGTRRLRATGWHPYDNLTRTQRRKVAEKRKESWLKSRSKDKRRLEIGLDQQTNWHIPQYEYTKSQVIGRSLAKKRGYVLGDMHESSGERYMVFYTAESKRGKRFEENLNKRGLTVKSVDYRKI